MQRLSDDPLGTTTTSSMERLIPRIERGDGGGCPILVVGITEACYEPPPSPVKDEIRRLIAEAGTPGSVRTVTVAELVQEGITRQSTAPEAEA